MKYILCYSGGKDSTAMLIHLLENKRPIDEILYVDVGDWVWESSKEHLRKVKDTFNVDITILDVSDELRKGFERWGFPSFLNRWCTGIKRETMRKYLREKYGERESIVQYIGYCADEEQRTSKKLYSSYEVGYPLVDAGITTEMALQICYDNGFDFGGVYEHHKHFNCWLCPLQQVKELEWIFNNDKDKWDTLRNMQHRTDGTYYPNKTIFDFEKRFWEHNIGRLKDERMKAREKYNVRGKKR